MPEQENEQPEELYLEQQEEIMKGLDPHLQDVILAKQADEPVDPALGFQMEDGSVVIDVIAKLHDPEQAVPGLTVVRTMGQIVTGTVEVDQIEAVRRHQNVISLKRATKLNQDLNVSVPEIRADAQGIEDALPPCTPMIDGSGVIVGIVDYGCDFNHDNFRHADGTTRLLYLWDQDGERSAASPAGFDYGREFDADTINQALLAPDPYQFLAYRPSPAAHGTHVMDIAAGNGRATSRPGVAPNADLIFVQVAAWDYGEEESFGNSRRLLEAVDYIFSKADALGRPAVINLSLGTHGGPHDGSTLVEQGFDQLLQTPGRAIVISAGNSYERRSHASGGIAPAGQRALGWEITSGDETDNELEVWYDGDRQAEVTLITPGGQRLGPVALGVTMNLMGANGRLGRIIHRQGDPNNGDNQVDILLDRALRGNWQVELHNTGNDILSFHSWIERDDFGQSRFAVADDDRTHTLGSISCGEHTLVVGSYDARLPGRNLSYFTSEGPTRDGREKPEISAPGHAIRAARSLTQGSTVKSGTSMAAPHVTGTVALLLQATDGAPDIEEVRDAVIALARRQPPAGNGWDGRYGSGRVDCLALILDQLGADEPVPVPDHAVTALPAALPAAAVAPAGDYTGTLLAALADTAGRMHTRVRIQIEMEPMAN